MQLDHRLHQNVLKFPVFYLVRHLSIFGKRQYYFISLLFSNS